MFWVLINATQMPNPFYVWLLMWMPGCAALLRCRILRRPLSTLGRTWNWRYVLIGYLIPIAYCLMESLGMGCREWADSPICLRDQTAESFGIGGAPWVVIAVFVTVLGSAGMIAGVGAATGEEFGWRGYLVTELPTRQPQPLDAVDIHTADHRHGIHQMGRGRPGAGVRGRRRRGAVTFWFNRADVKPLVPLEV